MPSLCHGPWCTIQLICKTTCKIICQFRLGDWFYRRQIHCPRDRSATNAQKMKTKQRPLTEGGGNLVMAMAWCYDLISWRQQFLPDCFLVFSSRTLGVQLGGLRKQLNHTSPVHFGPTIPVTLSEISIHTCPPIAIIQNTQSDHNKLNTLPSASLRCFWLSG